jgi:hypothetical protein
MLYNGVYDDKRKNNMSLIFTIWVNDGIIMASDSRTTFSVTNRKTVNIPVGVAKDVSGADITNINFPDTITTGHYFDTANKTFLCPNNCGISICGQASIGNRSVGSYIEKFIETKTKSEMSINELKETLDNYFKELKPTDDIICHLFGYDTNDNQEKFQKGFIITYNKENANTTVLDMKKPEAKWNGENAIFLNLIQGLTIPVEFMTLQDATDLARFAIKTTTETMKFTNAVKSVGGPIDILMIKPNDNKWISKKKLQ